MSQTRRNLTIEYLNLSFVITAKLTPLHSFYAENVFVSCIFWLISVLQVRTCPNFFDTNIFQHIVLDLKFSTRSVSEDISNQLKRKKCFARENAKKVVEGLGIGPFVTVTNLTPHSCSCGEILPEKLFLITCRV